MKGGIELFKKMNGLIIIIFILGVQIGCSVDQKGNGNQFVNETMETVIDVNKNGISIPYKQLLYTKNSSSFSWERNNTEELQKEITDRYEEFKNTVPGGFIVKETPTEYFICVSIGGKESVTEGFKIKSLTLPDDIKEENPTLKIDVIPVSNENTSDKEMKGEVYMRSLISVSKEDLPNGININSISMRLEDNAP
jgi:hypothetical protein